MILNSLKKIFAGSPEDYYNAFQPENLYEGVKTTAKGITKGLQTFGQGSMRGYAALSSAIPSDNVHSVYRQGKILTPSTQFQRDLYGTDQPITLKSFGEEIPGLKGSKFAPVAGFAVAASDLLPGGKFRKEVAVKALQTINKAEDALKVLNKVLGVSPKVSPKYAEAAAKLNTPKQLNNLVDNAILESQKVTEFTKRTVAGAKDLGVKIGNKLFQQVPEATKKELVDAIDYLRTGKVVPNIENTVSGLAQKYNINQDLPSNKIANFFEDLVDKTNTTQAKNFIAKTPTEAYGGVAGIERDEEGNISFDPKKAILGVAGMAAANKFKGDKKIRGFIESSKKIFDNDKIAGQYIPRSTNALAIKAKNLIKDDLIKAEQYALSSSDDAAVAVASELLKKYADEAVNSTDPRVIERAYDKAAEIANTIAPKLTEQGRAIQAASILGRLTPEGQVRFAAKEIQRYNQSGVTKRIPELTGEQAKIIMDEMRAINGMEEGLEKAMRFQKLQNMIQDLVPTPLMKKLTTIWKAGLLTGLKTHGLNIFSNLSHAATEVVKDLPASVVDSVASLFTGQRTKTFTLRGAGKGVAEGFKKGAQYLRTGFDERNIAGKLDYNRVNFGKGPVAAFFKGYTNTVFKAIGASDQPFYYGALARSLWDQAVALGKTQGRKGVELKKFVETMVESPTEEMLRYGVLDATTAVFQNKTKLGEVAKKIQSAGTLGEVILPFARTPSAVAMQIVNYSPLGLAKPAKRLFEAASKGEFDQRLFSQEVGRSLTGTGIMALGMELYDRGLISLDYPKGNEREQELQKAEGVKNNAIKIGDKWRSPIVLGPGGNLLLIGGHFKKALKNSGSPTEAMVKAAAGAGKSFTEQTFMTGVEDFINAVTDPERYAKSYLPNLVASAVPTIVSDVAKATDTKERKAGEGNIVNMAKEKIQARIPGARKSLEPQVDILGREQNRIGNPLEVLLDPTRPSPDKNTPVTIELRRLMDSGLQVAPTKLGDKNGYEGLSSQENTRLWKFAGSVLNDKLEALFADERYQNISDEKKGKIVEDFIDKAKLNARAGMVVELTQGLEGGALRKKLSELKAGGMMTREVFNKYQEIR